MVEYTLTETLVTLLQNSIVKESHMIHKRACVKKLNKEVHSQKPFFLDVFSVVNL